MERTRSKAKVAKAVEKWKRLQQLRKRDEKSEQTVKLEKTDTEDKGSQNSPPLKEIA